MASDIVQYNPEDKNFYVHVDAKRTHGPEFPIDYVSGYTNQPSAERVGVIIASNIGRPFGECNTGTGFTSKPKAKTQEESAMSVVNNILWDKTKTTLMDIHNVPDIIKNFTLKPNGSFEIPLFERTNGEIPNAHIGLRVADYSKTLSIDIRPAKNLLVVLAFAPNAGELTSTCTQTNPAGVCPHAPRTPRNGKLDTVYRTRDHRAATDYAYFKECLVAALTAALIECIIKGVTVVIIPAMGAGLYAGPHCDRLKIDYFTEIVERALLLTRARDRFSKIFAPDYNVPNVHHGHFGGGGGGIQRPGAPARAYGGGYLANAPRWWDQTMGNPECRYGKQCYRKDSTHLAKYSHPP